MFPSYHWGFCIVFLISNYMNYLPTDPSECPWTSEGAEVYEDRRAYIEMLLNLEAEESDDCPQEYPYRYGS